MHRWQKKHPQQFYGLTYSQGARGLLPLKAYADMCRLIGSWFSDLMQRWMYGRLFGLIIWISNV